MKNKIIGLAIGVIIMIFGTASVAAASSCSYTWTDCTARCGSLPSYPTFEKEACLTTCTDEDQQNLENYNACLDQEASVVDEPAVDEPAVDEPAVDEPVVNEPAVDEPVVAEKGLIENIVGTVKITRTNKRVVTAKDGFTLSEGESIETGDNSQVTITLKDGSQIQLRSNSKFNYLGEDSISKNFELSFGWIKASFEKILLKRFTIRTPTAVLSIRGTELMLTYDEDTQITELNLIDGDVEFTPTSTNKTSEYSAGDTVTIDENGKIQVSTLTESDWTDLEKEFEIEDSATIIPFSDVLSTHIHIEGITYGQNHKIFEGYSDGTFKPDNPVNRAEFTKIVVNAIYPGQASGAGCFPDVKDEWFAEFVCFAKGKNILGGYPNGTFQPVNNINFSEGAKIIVNAFGIDVDTSDPIWYKPFIEELGLRRAIPTTITGFGQLMTRGEMAEIVYRLLEKVTDKPSQTYSILESLESGELDIPEVLDSLHVWYENQNLAFKIKQLATWQVQESDVEGLPVVYFISPATGEGDFQEMVNVIVEDLSANPMTLEEYSDYSLTQLKEIFPNFTQLSLNSANLGNQNAKKIVYTVSSEGVVQKVMQIWTVIGQKAYVLSFNTVESLYGDFEKDVEDMIASFEFL